ncbi:MAG: hypothetical protein GEV11_03315 [Streptosporangiales bacterium]|nr:hypothetical protein [Streptosporangiales bacterium]
MPEPEDVIVPLGPPRDDTETSHELVVPRPHELLRNGKVAFEVRPGGDTGWRQAVPLTYDVPLDNPKSPRTDEPA